MIETVNTRQIPKRQFRVKLAYGPYQKGAIIEPTGIYRDMLLSKGLIEPVTPPDEPPAVAQGTLLAPSALNRRRK